MTATVETVVEQLDLAPIILTERIIPTITRAVTLPENEHGEANLVESASIGFFHFERAFLMNAGVCMVQAVVLDFLGQA